MSYMSEQRRTLSFRRLPFAAKRRRARPLLAALRRLAKVTAVTAPAVVCLAWLIASSQFSLTEIDIQGADRVDPSWIEAELSGVAGSSILLLDLKELRMRLEKHPWISSLRLTKELPRRLHVRVVEHSPSAVLLTDEGSFLLTPAGERIVALAEGIEFEGFLIDGRGQDSTAQDLGKILEVAVALRGSDIPWASHPVWARVLSPEDVELAFDGTGFLMRVRSSQEAVVLEEQIVVLDGLLPQLLDRLGSLDTVDLRFHRRIVLAPSVQEAFVRHEILSNRSGHLQQQARPSTSWMSSPAVAHRG